MSLALRAFLAQHILCASRSSTLFRPLLGVARPTPADRITTRTRWARPCNPKGVHTMANIGTFTVEKDGFTGTLRTLCDTHLE